MKTLFFPGRGDKKSQQGVTLVEVLLAVAMIAILAIAAAHSLFYPQWLITNSALEQSATHVGVGEIERNLHAINAAARGMFNTDNWIIEDDNTDTTVISASDDNADDFDTEVPNTSGDNADYYVIRSKVEYRDGKSIDVTTYRSKNPPNSQR